MVSLAQNLETLRTEERTLDQQSARFRSLRLLLFSLLVVGLWLGYALALARVRSGLVILKKNRRTTVRFMLYNSRKPDTQLLAQPVHVAERLKGIFVRQVLIAAAVIALLVFLPVSGATQESPQPVGDAKQPASEPERLSQEVLDAELFSAAKRGDAIEVQKLLAKGASVHARDGHSFGDALVWAAGLGHVEVVKVLIASLSPGENITGGFFTIDPLRVPVVTGQDEAGRVWLEARPKDLEKKELSELLSGAAFFGRSKFVETLLQFGADANFTDEDCPEVTTLTWASVFGRSTIAQQLREAGAAEGVLFPPDTNGRDRHLQRAAHEGDTDTVRSLLAEGASLEAREDVCQDWLDSWTPLFWAAAAGHRDTVEVLLDAGADIDAEDDDNFTALNMAALLGHLDVVQALLDGGADPNKPGAREGPDWLYEYAVHLDSPGSALATAAGMGHAEVVRVLLAGGADVDGRTHCEPDACEEPSLISTPLMIATVFNHIAVVETLLHAGADIDLRNGNGKTALDLATEYGRPEIAQLLRDFIRARLEQAGARELASVETTRHPRQTHAEESAEVKREAE